MSSGKRNLDAAKERQRDDENSTATGMFQRSESCALGPFCTVELAHIIYFLLPQASGSQKKPPVGSERKRPATVAKKEGKKNAEPTGKKPKESKANIRAEKLKEIPENKKTHKTLCLWMTYGDSTHSRVEIPGATYNDSLRHLPVQIQNMLCQPPTQREKEKPIAAGECDLIRLLMMEHHLKVQAYTISQDQQVSNERHLTHNLASSKPSSQAVRDKWEGISFDQVTWDYLNTPDSYIGMKNINILKLLKDVSLHEPPLLNPAGGAVYLPFRLQFYAVVAGNESELEKYYEIDFLSNEIVAEENDLYRGTLALGEDARKLLKIRGIDEKCVTKSSIMENGAVAGISMEEVKKHYEKLCKLMGEEYVKSICTIRLQYRPPASLPK